VAEDIYACPVRLGYPICVGGLTKLVNNPRYSTALGLLLYGLENHGGERVAIMKQSKGGLFSGVKEWFSRSLG
jgi:cell division protein FtsA